MFETKNINRIRLGIHPENSASRRLAEKYHFRHEGKHHDVEIYAILRGEVIGS